jgi:hypothetical protein
MQAAKTKTALFGVSQLLRSCAELRLALENKLFFACPMWGMAAIALSPRAA